MDDLDGEMREREKERKIGRLMMERIVGALGQDERYGKQRDEMIDEDGEKEGSNQRTRTGGKEG